MKIPILVCMASLTAAAAWPPALRAGGADDKDSYRRRNLINQGAPAAVAEERTELLASGELTKPQEVDSIVEQGKGLSKPRADEERELLLSAARRLTAVAKVRLELGDMAKVVEDQRAALELIAMVKQMKASSDAGRNSAFEKEIEAAQKAAVSLHQESQNKR